ncbi:MAG: hypothetical protein Q8N99_04950 [Nanoarchaeota archaeon]|nr:hypothetical protein [Nanoarchaeota archaeon]
MKQFSYLDFLKQFRVKIPLATSKHYPNLEVQVEGDIPEEIKQQLPIFGRRGPVRSGSHALNSGGRGILLFCGKKYYRFKGNDIDGSITIQVGESKKNQISDIRQVADRVKTLEFNTSALNSGGVYLLPEYQGKLFSFFTQDSVNREKYASEAIGSAFEQRGFLRPYKFEASITYPNIQFHGQPCSTLVFSLPSLESDLRFAEFYRFAFLHLKFATPDELEDIKTKFGNFLSDLTSWHGFLTLAMAENRLAPTTDSFQNQNYVICHVTNNQVGISRVDHTSTVVDRDKGREHARLMDRHSAFFADQELSLFHALELSKHGYELDENRFVGYFDRAMKWYPNIDGEINYNAIPGAREYLEQLRASFNQGLRRVPVPISVERFISLIYRISQINIDEGRLRNIELHRQRILGEQ